MVQTYQETGDPLMAPSVVSYNALINAWGKCNPKDLLTVDAPQQAEKILAEMLEAMEYNDNNINTNNIHNNKNNNNNNDNSVTMHDHDINQQYDNYDYFDESRSTLSSWSELKPDAITFSTLIDTYAKQYSSKQWIPANSVRRCEELFEMMDALGVKKNAYTYSALQNVYARCGTKDAPDKALAVLNQMMVSYYQNGDVFAKPNAINFNGTL
jgi:hypothetical protein